MCQFSGKTDNLNFKNLSLDSESVPPRYRVTRIQFTKKQQLQDTKIQFSVKMDNFEFLSLKFPDYVRYFGSNNVKGVVESWVEVKMSWVEVDGAG